MCKYTFSTLIFIQCISVRFYGKIGFCKIVGYCLAGHIVNVICMLFIPTGPFDYLTESSVMLLFALRRCRYYMSASHQEFSSTASLILDGPSKILCIPPQSSTVEVKLSFAGNIIGEFLEYCTHVGVSVVCVSVCVCVCLCSVCV